MKYLITVDGSDYTEVYEFDNAEDADEQYKQSTKHTDYGFTEVKVYYSIVLKFKEIKTDY